jgi:predicted Holliday junction resolvase-like endonuclease
MIFIYFLVIIFILVLLLIGEIFKIKKIKNLLAEKIKLLKSQENDIVEYKKKEKALEDIINKNQQNNIPENRQKLSNDSFLCSCGNYKSENLSIQLNQNKENAN